MRNATWVRQFLAGIVALLVALIWALARHHEAGDERPVAAVEAPSDTVRGTGL